MRATQRPSADRPTLLMVGAGDPMDAALRVALDRHGLFVEAVGLDNLRRSVHLTAPDIILLLGDAAEQGGLAALSILAEDPSTAAVPVVLLAADSRLESRMYAFRHGAMAVVPRHASSDAIAKKIASLSRELSEHFEEKTGEIGEGTFDELVDIVKKELRSGILSVHAPKHKGGPLRVVLGAGRPVAAAVQEFVARLKPHVTAAESMYYQFHTSAGGPVELLEMGDSDPSGDVEQLRRLRVLLVDDDPGRADTLAQELRGRGALVFVTDTAGRGLERASGLDPQVAIVDAAGLEGKGFEVVRQMRRDLRLRWASILVAPWDEIWPKGAPAPDIEKLAARIAPFLAPERDLAERSASPDAFDTRLEGTGPSRLLRTLVESGETMHLTIRNPKATIDCDLAQGLLVGASATLANGAELLGPAAIATLLALGSARIHVERRSHPSVANIMSPVDEALSLASKERTSIPASEPPAAPEWAKLTVPFPKVNVSAAKTPAEPTPRAAAKPTAAKPTAPTPTPRPAAKPIETPTTRPAAKMNELVIDMDDDEPATTPIVPAPVKAPAKIAPTGGPVAANERAAKLATQRRRSTLLMGSEDDKPTVVPPAPAAPAPEVRAPEGAPLGSFEIEESAEIETEGSTEVDASIETVPDARPLIVESEPPPPEPPPPQRPMREPSIDVALPAHAQPPAPRAPRLELPSSMPPPRPKRSFARVVATLSVTIASIVLAGVLGLIGYRYSGYHHPAVDRVLVVLGTAPREPRVPRAAIEPAVEPPPEQIEPPPEPPPEPIEPPPEPPQQIEPPPEQIEPPPEQIEPPPEQIEPPTEPIEPPPEPVVEEVAGESVDAIIRRADGSPPPVAERLYRRALELDPRNHYAMLGLARVARSRGDRAQEIEFLRSAVERRPRRASYRILLGDALRASGDADAARQEYERALEYEPDNAQARSRLGQ